METIKQNILKWWVALSALALVIMYVIVDRRGRTIDQLKDDAKKQVLAQHLLTIREQAKGDVNDYNKAMESYVRLKFVHGDELRKWGVFGGGDAQALKQYSSKPDSSSDGKPS